MSDTSPAPWPGIWKRDLEEPAETPLDKHLPWHDAFVMHPDGTVSVHLLAISPQPTDSPDGVYRMETRRRGDVFYYRLANGVEVELASWRNGRFEMEGDGLRRTYRRVEPQELAPIHRPLLDAGRPLSKARKNEEKS